MKTRTDARNIFSAAENREEELSADQLSRIVGGDKKKAATSDTPSESVTLNFSKIEWAYSSL